jgi:hypothetical protein
MNPDPRPQTPDPSRASQIAAFHSEYERLTGYRIALMGREWCWFEWLKRDLTLTDLRLLVADTKTKIARGELTSASLQFRNLIGQVDFAEEKIADLRVRRRVPTMDASRASILRQTGRSDSPSPSGRGRGEGERTAAEVVAKLTQDPAAAERAFKELQQLKNNL